MPCDLTDFDALDRLGAAIYERWGKLDILVGNAGMLGSISPLAHLDPKDWDKVMAVNVTANWRLIRSLDMLLRASDAGRVVLMTSGAGTQGGPVALLGLYATSKAALDAIGRTYAAETKTTSNVRVTLVKPGYVRTRMRAQAMPGEDPMTLPTPEDIAPQIVKLCTPEWTETGVLYDLPGGRGAPFPGAGVAAGAAVMVGEGRPSTTGKRRACGLSWILAFARMTAFLFGDLPYRPMSNTRASASPSRETSVIAASSAIASPSPSSRRTPFTSSAPRATCTQPIRPGANACATSSPRDSTPA